MAAATNGDIASHDIGIPRLTEAKEQPPSTVVPIRDDDVPSANGFAPDTVKKESPDLLNGTAPAVPYPKSRLELLDRFIDEPRPLRVAVIGGGLSGILAGILLPIKVPGIKLTIYEKNHDVSGTWLENVYPGVRCDIPSHVYQSTFSPKLDWSDQFAPGAEIRDYWQGQARKYDVYQYTKLGQNVEATDWDESKSVWRLSIRDVASGELRVEEAEFVLTALGRFNAWRLPDYPGISEYKGLLRHASHWDPTFDPAGKKVAVIGNGASGIQLVANLQPVVAHLDHYARNRTWIAASWAGDERTLEPQPISDEQKKSFEDPEVYLKFRKELENKYWRRFATFFKDHPDNQALRDNFTKIMRKRLAKKPELLEDIVPDFSPNCRRLTPGPGYLEAITEDNVDYIRTPIKRFTETGIETTDGKHREVDAIFCATGANVDMVPPFPIRANGQDLATTWRPGGKHGYPYTYLGLATPGFPNLLFVHGPHGTGPSGTVPHSVEVQLTYFAKLLRKASREGIKSITPSQKAADDFVEYADAFFAKTVLSDNCSSWYNGGRPGGRIHGIWPGSAGHVTAVRREPRWEDWEYEYLSDTGNRFHWYFGNGWTRKEADPESDMTSYLQVPEKVDLRDYHESWWSLP
ncbi:FAD/NAD(P)-binding domain-containing protein [Coniochaeta ligniaria NRRL 30616]|uniref:FAD/NAD(P)-binding domain-containing protein n=1 Tax=Coniochaeta ligniaria NRRL 30616 TaxID=1408157 RepID=A0A1J7IB64_9PEZI|nr:FAD/NAD(P)-binding domain-containing protein [Coniochaeta ligniaria NRRL 30616]